jgi:hypothetical protein
MKKNQATHRHISIMQVDQRRKRQDVDQCFRCKRRRKLNKIRTSSRFLRPPLLTSYLTPQIRCKIWAASYIWWCVGQSLIYICIYIYIYTIYANAMHHGLGWWCGAGVCVYPSIVGVVWQEMEWNNTLRECMHAPSCIAICLQITSLLSTLPTSSLHGISRFLPLQETDRRKVCRLALITCINKLVASNLSLTRTRSKLHAQPESPRCCS